MRISRTTLEYMLFGPGAPAPEAVDGAEQSADSVLLRGSSSSLSYYP